MLTAPDGLKRIWFSLDSPSQYFPLVYTAFRLERKIWGLDAAPYHWANILLHALNALLVWRVLTRLKVPAAWLGAALFALHPVQTESVAWITERKNILSLFFCLLATLSWLAFTDRSRRGEEVEGSKRSESASLPRRLKPWQYYVLAFLLYLLALFSKTTACTLPVAFLLLDWWKLDRIRWQRLLQMVPFFLAALFMGLVTVWWEHHHQGVEGKLTGFTLIHRILIASHAIWFYFGKLLWPANLTFSYPLWRINPSDPMQYGWLLACLVAVVALFFLRRQTGKGLQTALLFYVIILGPLLGFFMLATFKFSFVADHYQYAACIGPLALIAAGIMRVVQNAAAARLVVPGALLLVLAALTFQQAGIYHDRETLWRSTVETNPQSFMAQNNLAIELLNRGRLDDAILHYEKAVEIQPDEALTRLNLGKALTARGRLDEAITHLRKALELQPDGASIAFALGNALVSEGKLDEAINYYQKSFDLQPDSAAVANTLGSAWLAKGNLDRAIIWFSKAVALAPTMAKAHANLGGAFARKRQFGEAITQFQTAVELQPTNVPALNNLAWLLATCPDGSLRDGQKAVNLARQADQLSRGQSADILITLAAAYAEVQEYPEAVSTVRRALESPAAKSDPVLAASMQEKIRLFESKTPFRTE